ncbi:hypothetical protein L0P88_03980 [Muricauda sp. SCSIO 64092]|uniref:hypothetical protein n=1 Tax=Allomuricauda sp. SCSIO 64092 TaxID=2908842 RepID=UPI001FF433D1|nr:hypothetical protein [Muricauda sp. SCSIO 64092]UOY07713.1 hypothetical protein L0P88_03980 [Muricauda sp. SCSIO 64092]
MSVHRLSHKDYLGLHQDNLFYYEITGAEREATTEEVSKESFTDWRENAIDVGDFKVIPFGNDNDIQKRIQESVLPNSLAPRIQNRKVELLFEQGPFLYQEKVDGRNFFREPIENPRIKDWLEEIDYEELLLNNANDYYYNNMVFNKVFRNLGGRIGLGGIADLKHEEAFDCRLAYRKNDSKGIPTHVLVTNWEDYQNNEVKVYPLFDRKNPTRHRISMHFSKLKSFGLKDYAMPEIYGSLDWIDNSTSIPKVFKALTKNSLNIKWHIQSPAAYWDQKRKQIKENCQAAQPPVQYQEKMLLELREQILGKLSTLLSGVENVGKFWHNEYVVQLVGANAVEQGWKILPIEQKIKEYVDAQIAISDKADFATVAGLGLHAALGNVGADGKSDSGSEQYYALQNHQRTSTPIPELIICKPLNECIKHKFNSKIKVGLYHLDPLRLQDITESSRTPSITQQ